MSLISSSFQDGTARNPVSGGADVAGFPREFEKIPGSVHLVKGWRFRKILPVVSEWKSVQLPHNPFTASLHGPGNWEGICEYVRELHWTSEEDGVPNGQGSEREEGHGGGSVISHCLEFGAAMSKARVFLDELLLAQHEGGYLPFVVDLQQHLLDEKPHQLRVELDNRWDPTVPPGKPHNELDFCCYGGLYRDIRLLVRREVYIVHENECVPSGAGAVYLQTRSFCQETQRAELLTQVHLRNPTARKQTVVLHQRIVDEHSGILAAHDVVVVLDAVGDRVVTLQHEVEGVLGWTPLSPKMYSVFIEVKTSAGDVLDSRFYRFGFRVLQISASTGLVINGRRFRPRGCNRHQDHPYVGYALPDNAQYRDAVRIKEAGFDYVRLSHYPQSPAFLRACDELGILVMNSIPGWQQMTDARFREACLENARQLIRRDRNHPCVVLWELSLNETEMDAEFIASMHRIGKEESLELAFYTCGWMPGYDVYLRARQHGGLHEPLADDQALVISEYGDWEYYAGTDGFDQAQSEALFDAEFNSRVFRGDGPDRLLRQAQNHMEALEEMLRTPAIADGLWCMFDYPRGYHQLRAGCGIMDFFRLPKWSFYFYRSQRHADEVYDGVETGPMVFIAYDCMRSKPGALWVFSNLSRVELYVNGTSIGVSEVGETSLSLPHPPHVFHVKSFHSGVMEARASSPCGSVASHRIKTAGTPARLEVWVDFKSRYPGADAYLDDLLFVHAAVVDEEGCECSDAQERVSFELEAHAAAEWIGPKVVETEAGIASGMFRIAADVARVTLRCESESGLRGFWQLPSSTFL